MQNDLKQALRAMGFGPELDEFPVRLGDSLVAPRADPSEDIIVDGIRATWRGIWLSWHQGAPNASPGSPYLLGDGLACHSKQEYGALSAWFDNAPLFAGQAPTPEIDARYPGRPRIPAYFAHSAVALSAWYFGRPGLAAERASNQPYRYPDDLMREASGKFVFVEDLATGREFLCLAANTSDCVPYRPDLMNCSLYEPYLFRMDGIGSGWAARARPLHGTLPAV